MNLYKRCPDTYVESTKYALDKKEFKDIRENEIKNEMFPDISKSNVESLISSEKGTVEKDEWMKGTFFIKVNVWKKLTDAYIKGFKKSVLENKIRSSDDRYQAFGMKGGIDAAIEFVDKVNINNQRLNEKYKAEIPIVDTDAEKKNIFESVLENFLTPFKKNVQK